MSNKPSPEEALRQKLSKVPLPDENASWQKMSALLDEKEKRRPFVFFRNEKLAGGALLLCGLLLWFALSVQTKKKAANSVAHDNITIGKANEKHHPNEMTSKADSNKTNKQSQTMQANPDTAFSPSIISHSAVVPVSANTRLSFEKKSNYTVKKRSATAQINTGMTSVEKRLHTKDIVLQNQMQDRPEGSKDAQKTTSVTDTDSVQLSVLENNNNAVYPDSISNNQNALTSESNSLKTDSFSASSATAKTTIKTKPRSTYFIDAGIGVKQQLPVDSQRFAAYHYNGNKSWLGDYIPFLCIRLEKDKQWFVQGEFHYAAPRLINGVYYRQQSKADYSHSTASTDRYYLQKVWYDEVPLSLNIYVRPSLSVGAGAMYSQLRGAAVQRTTSEYEILSGQYNNNIGQMPWKGFTDSFLYKTNTSLLVQTGYRIQKWSFGVRYLYDLHPYITYTLPDGNRRDKRNASLEVMIQYRLYRSGMFRIGGL